MTHAIRHVPFPTTPAQVDACLDLAKAGAIVIERGGAPAIAIMPVKEYERLDALDRRIKQDGRPPAADLHRDVMR